MSSEPSFSDRRDDLPSCLTGNHGMDHNDYTAACSLADDLLAEVERLTAERDELVALHHAEVVRLAGDVRLALAASLPVRQAAEAWAAAYDEKAATLAAWQAERLSGITSATPAYDAMNNGYASFKAASVALRAALSGEHPLTEADLSTCEHGRYDLCRDCDAAGRQVDEQ